MDTTNPTNELRRLSIEEARERIAMWMAEPAVALQYGASDIKAEAQCEAYGNCLDIMSRVEAQGPQWQPIETAPKDGTEIYIYPEEEVAWHRQGAWQLCGCTCDGAKRVAQIEPTHWMPLPDPPNLSKVG